MDHRPAGEAPLDRVEPATPQEVERRTVPPAGRTRALRPEPPVVEVTDRGVTDHPTATKE
jgi:hypothetical protein